MNEEEKNVYELARGKASGLVFDLLAEKAKFTNILAQLTMLRQLADHYQIINQ